MDSALRLAQYALIVLWMVVMMLWASSLEDRIDALEQEAPDAGREE